MSRAAEHMTQQELESYLWGAANLLRGLIDAGDYKQYVFPLLFFKRLSDVWDGFAKVASVDDVLANGGSLAIPRYVRPIQPGATARGARDLATAWAAFDASGREFWQQIDEVIETLDATLAEEEVLDVG
jgi:type I restriction-modification system DNA methylase subunit